MEGINIVRGSQSDQEIKQIVSAFNKEVVRQILLGHRVVLPWNIEIDVIKHINDTGKVQPRLGFNYKVRVVCDKLKRKKVKFTTDKSLQKMLSQILKETDFEYKLVTNGYQ